MATASKPLTSGKQNEQYVNCSCCPHEHFVECPQRKERPGHVRKHAHQDQDTKWKWMPSLFRCGVFPVFGCIFNRIQILNIRLHASQPKVQAENAAIVGTTNEPTVMIRSTSRIPSRKGPVTHSAPVREAAGGSSATPPLSSAESAGAPEPSVSSASTVFLGLTSELQALAASRAADIDYAAVSAVKAALAKGTLAIDTERTADGVLATARELLGASAGHHSAN